MAEADRRGLDLRSQRARRIQPDDWERFDLLLVADDPVERALLRQAPPGADLSKVRRMTDFGPDAGAIDEVPDPYYGGEDGFELVYKVVERACGGLLDHVRGHHGIAGDDG